MKKVLMGVLLIGTMAFGSNIKCKGLQSDAKAMDIKMDKMYEHAQLAQILEDNAEVDKAIVCAKEAKSLIKHMVREHKSQFSIEMLELTNKINTELNGIIEDGERIKKLPRN